MRYNEIRLYLVFFMDQTTKLILDKVTQLTNRLNVLTQNSKRIHELFDYTSNEDVFIAVSDGVNTGKVIYKPNEVSKYEFDNISNLYLNLDSENKLSIHLSDGTVLSVVSLGEDFKTSLFDESFIFDSAINPTQQFTLAFIPTQVDAIFDTNTPIWLDNGDFTVVGNVLKINYPLEQDALIKIKYWHLI